MGPEGCPPASSQYPTSFNLPLQLLSTLTLTLIVFPQSRTRAKVIEEEVEATIAKPPKESSSHVVLPLVLDILR